MPLTLNHPLPFEMLDDVILLKDFNGSTYTISYNGETISYKK
jgi:hypothetical protein